MFCIKHSKDLKWFLLTFTFVYKWQNLVPPPICLKARRGNLHISNLSEKIYGILGKLKIVRKEISYFFYPSDFSAGALPQKINKKNLQKCQEWRVQASGWLNCLFFLLGSKSALHSDVCMDITMAYLSLSFLELQTRGHEKDVGESALTLARSSQ